MSGHSKWSQIRRQKGVNDARRGQLFTKLAREITVAAREGGGDPDANFRLRLAIQKARESNMPAENIQRGIVRGTGAGEGGHLEEIVYEGYGPGGAAIMVEALTDNRNRTIAEVRNVFARNGGNLGETGSVSWMFEPHGVILIACGRWSMRIVAATAALLLLSIILWPAWPLEWIQHGNLQTYNGVSPVMVLPGFILLSAIVAWRSREGRLVLAMSIVAQRYLYDQLPLYLVPKTWRQMLLLLLTSWAGVIAGYSLKWMDDTGAQNKHAWSLLIVTLFLPALGVLFFNRRKNVTAVSCEAS